MTIWTAVAREALQRQERDANYATMELPDGTGPTMVMPAGGYLTNLTVHGGALRVDAGDRIAIRMERPRGLGYVSFRWPKRTPLISRNAWLCAAGIAGVIVWAAFWWVYSSMV